MASISIFYRLFTLFMFYFSYIIWPVLTFFYKEEKKMIPTTSDVIFTYSATKLAQKIRKKEITSEEVVKKFIERIKKVNPIINAMVQDRFDEAAREAIKTDVFLNTTELTEKELDITKPLLGVPISIKESISVEGMSLTGGSLEHFLQVAQKDAAVVSKLKLAGAIPICITNTPEYCLSIETYNFITGDTKNPHNTLYNSGGSSGGEGALIGSGASVCGIGSDIAGSIRIPAAFNGIFGHKPTVDMVDLEGHFPLSSDWRGIDQLSIGPMTRYAEDLELLTKIIAGKNLKRLNLDVPVNLRNLKIFYMEDCGFNFGNLKVQEEIKDSINAAVNFLGINHNAIISQVKFEDLKFSTEIASKLHFAIDQYPNFFLQYVGVIWEMCISMIGFYCIHPFNTLLYSLVKRCSWMITMTPEKCDEAVRKIREDMTKNLCTNGVLLYPSFPTGAIPHWGSFYALSGASYLCIFNALGFPATSIPIGFDRKGLPIAIQVIAAPDQDRLCFAVAKELEKFFGGCKAPY